MFIFSNVKVILQDPWTPRFVIKVKKLENPLTNFVNES
jgi:hypothetical protein